MSQGESKGKTGKEKGREEKEGFMEREGVREGEGGELVICKKCAEGAPDAIFCGLSGRDFFQI